MRFDRIILHHSAGNEYETVTHARDGHLARGFVDVAYHYWIHRLTRGSLDLRAGRPLELDGGGTSHNNRRSLQVCVAGSWHLNELPADTRAFLLGWLEIWLHLYRLSPDDVFGHNELPNEHTLCPGFDVAPLRRALLNR